ncbi:amidohydrolase family protein [Nocardia africana]|nr:amidohydrolase family protein [Nocardia africana]MCC3313615.1 amidohydrolase [Nocardia africana]
MCDDVQDRAESVDEAAAVVAFHRSLGLPGLIDVHTHFMPKSVMDKVWQYFDNQGPLVGRPWPITYRDDEAARVDRLRRFGVRAFTSLIYPHRPEMAAWLNQWAAEFAAHTPDCLHTATLYPEPTVGDYVGDALAAGAQVFKAHVQVGGYDPADQLLDPAWSAIADAGVPVVIHCGSSPTATAYTGPEPIARLLSRHPRLQLIIAHMGMGQYREFFDLAARFPTIRFDTAVAFTDHADSFAPFSAVDLPRLADLGDRILFGSDYPSIPYTYAEGLAGLAALDLGADWLRRVCYQNAADLFGLGDDRLLVRLGAASV